MRFAVQVVDSIALIFNERLMGHIVMCAHQINIVIKLLSEYMQMIIRIFRNRHSISDTTKKKMLINCAYTCFDRNA